MLRFVTAEGNACTWFASGSFEDGAWELGKEYLLAGTIKKNDNYQGMAQTVLTRCTKTTCRTRRSSGTS